MGIDTPGQHFPAHFVVAIGNAISDPSYGVKFESSISLNDALAAWKVAAIAVVFSERPSDKLGSKTHGVYCR